VLLVPVKVPNDNIETIITYMGQSPLAFARKPSKGVTLYDTDITHHIAPFPCWVYACSD